ncbi:MAG: restriction endonuclease [Halobacteria archaeon]|nr:restriction endonuclease [Halobacteria archaeon]
MKDPDPEHELENAIEGMDWPDFKEFVIEFFEDAGYKIINVRRGVLDEAFYLTTVPPEESEKKLVQIKYNTKGNTVNQKEIRDSMGLHNLQDEIGDIVIVTNTEFTEKARELARGLNVTLMEQDEISVLVTPHRNF